MEWYIIQTEYGTKSEIGGILANFIVCAFLFSFPALKFHAHELTEYCYLEEKPIALQYIWYREKGFLFLRTVELNNNNNANWVSML